MNHPITTQLKELCDIWIATKHNSAETLTINDYVKYSAEFYAIANRINTTTTHA